MYVILRNNYLNKYLLNGSSSLPLNTNSSNSPFSQYSKIKQFIRF